MRRAASATLSTLPAHKTALKQISSQSGWSQRGQGGSGKVEKTYLSHLKLESCSGAERRQGRGAMAATRS